MKAIPVPRLLSRLSFPKHWAGTSVHLAAILGVAGLLAWLLVDRTDLFRHRLPVSVVAALSGVASGAALLLLTHDDQLARRKVAECLGAGEALRQSWEELRRESRDLQTALEEHASVAITDPGGRILYVNDKFCAVSKYSRQELLGKDHRLINSGYHSKDFMRQLWATILSGRTWKGEIRNRTKDGKYYWEDTTIVPLLGADKEIRAFAAIRTDITERKQAEEQTRLAQNELRAALIGLKRKHEELQGFYHTVSHEVKTPLTSAREFVSLVLEGLAGPVNETQKEYLSIAQQSCDQMRTCINDMLDVTRLQTGKIRLEFKPVSPGELARRMVVSLTPAAAQKRVRLTCAVRSGVSDIMMDQTRIAQVLTNLLGNALKFTPAGGQVSVVVQSADSEAGHVQMIVTDTGCGIPAEDLPRIFERLYQVPGSDNSSRRGLGLGLHIARELVRLHHGTIRVESTVGVGSTFYVTLPLSQPEAPMAAVARTRSCADRIYENKSPGC